MANILLASWPAAGHINSMLPIARELASRKHRIAWYTGRKYQPMIEELGIEYKPIDKAGDYSGMTNIEAFPQLEGLSGLEDFIMSWKLLFVERSLLELQDMLRIVEQFPANVVIAEETFFGAGLLHEKTGIPWVMVASAIYFYPSIDAAPLGMALPPDNSFVGKLRNRFMNFMSGHIILKELKQSANAVRTQAGLPPNKRGAPTNTVTEPDLYLLGTVPSFEYPRRDMLKSARFVGTFDAAPPENFEPPTWWDDLNTDKPVIHVLGRVTEDVDDLILPAINAFANEDVLLVITTGDATLEKLDLKTLPPNVRIEKFIAHYHLLPCVDVMITNGRYGAIQVALANGVPVIVITESPAHRPEIGRRVEWAKVGLFFKARNLPAEQIRNAVGEVLDNPSYAQKAKIMQDEYSKYNAPQMAANLVEELISHKKA